MTDKMLIDTHAHLDEQAFETDREEVLQRARAEGVLKILTIGVTLETSRAAVELSRSEPGVWAVVGIQPNYVSEAGPEDFEEVVALANEDRVVAIGETGLDRYWDSSPLELQQEYFHRHLQLAQQLDKPFVVHCREAEADVVAVLEEAAGNGPLRGVMHSFCGDLQTAQRCVELGLHISFAGMLTFKSNQALRDIAAAMPSDRLLVETDSPYLAPVPMRGKRNEPAHVVHTARCLAEVRHVSLDEIARLTTENARRLFRLPE